MGWLYFTVRSRGFSRSDPVEEEISGPGDGMIWDCELWWWMRRHLHASCLLMAHQILNLPCCLDKTAVFDGGVKVQ